MEATRLSSWSISLLHVAITSNYEVIVTSLLHVHTYVHVYACILMYITFTLFYATVDQLGFAKS